jgi:hypothetical protein
MNDCLGRVGFWRRDDVLECLLDYNNKVNGGIQLHCDHRYSIVSYRNHSVPAADSCSADPFGGGELEDDSVAHP